MPRDNFSQDPDFSKPFNPPDLSGLDSLNSSKTARWTSKG